MAISAAGKISAQRMIFVLGGQDIAVNQQANHGFKFLQILAAPSRQPNIPFELAGTAESSHTPKSEKSFFLLVKCLTPLPRLLP